MNKDKDSKSNLPAPIPESSSLKKTKSDIRSLLDQPESAMTNDRIRDFLTQNPSVTKLNTIRPGVWAFAYDGIEAHIMTDDRNGVDRMRIMAKVADDPKTHSHFASSDRLLQANCHEALDARFCYENDGSLWAAFIHRLSTLQEIDLESGLQQTTQLVKGYPMSLSSLDIYFRGNSLDG